MNKTSRRRLTDGEASKGFTIVELLIATAIFSVVLLVATTGVIAIGRLYHKGVTSAKTQEVTRALIEDISRSRQFSGINMITTDAGGGSGAVCFGQDRYSYRINDVGYGLRFDNTRPDRSVCPPINASDPARQLLSNNMRLLRFEVTAPAEDNPNTFNVIVKVAYGDNDLLTHYDVNGALNGTDPAAALCRGGPGSDFCSVSELATSVNKRVK